MRAARSFGCGVVKSLPTGTWVPLAPSRVGGGVRVSPFRFIFHHGFPLFNTSRRLVCLDLEAARFCCPKDGPYWPHPEVPLGGFGESPVGLVFPPSVVLGDFRGLTFGSGWAACGLPAPFALGILRGWNMHAVRRPFDRRLEPLFSSWLGSLQSFFCARLTLVFGTAFQGSCGTRWRMSPSPRDRRTGRYWS